MVGSKRGRGLEAERAGFAGRCEQCREVFRGRVDKRFCSDRCRTRFGRKRKDREIAETISRLQRLAGVKGA